MSTPTKAMVALVALVILVAAGTVAGAVGHYEPTMRQETIAECKADPSIVGFLNGGSLEDQEAFCVCLVNYIFDTMDEDRLMELDQLLRSDPNLPMPEDLAKSALDGLAACKGTPHPLTPAGLAFGPLHP